MADNKNRFIDTEEEAEEFITVEPPTQESVRLAKGGSERPGSFPTGATSGDVRKKYT